MPKMPTWKSPKNIAKALKDGDGFWEDERWLPIQLTAMSGTEFKGRKIPVAWQIELDPPEDEFELPNAKLEGMEIEPDGYGWGEYIYKCVRKSNPALAKKLHTTDCESDTCVIWVEAAEDCCILVGPVSELIFMSKQR